jgi:hypothetical protein
MWEVLTGCKKKGNDMVKAKGLVKIYWCCPNCGQEFWRDAFGMSNTNHICPANPGAITVCNKPETETKEVKKCQNY